MRPRSSFGSGGATTRRLLRGTGGFSSAEKTRVRAAHRAEPRTQGGLGLHLENTQFKHLAGKGERSGDCNKRHKTPRAPRPSGIRDFSEQDRAGSSRPAGPRSPKSEFRLRASGTRGHRGGNFWGAEGARRSCGTSRGRPGDPPPAPGCHRHQRLFPPRSVPGAAIGATGEGHHGHHPAPRPRQGPPRPQRGAPAIRECGMERGEGERGDGAG